MDSYHDIIDIFVFVFFGPHPYIGRHALSAEFTHVQYLYGSAGPVQICSPLYSLSHSTSMFASRDLGQRRGLGMHYTQDVSMQNANPTVSCVGVIAIEVTTGKTEHGVRDPREDPGGSV